MSYIPGAGRKKPLNNLEAPIYPDIKRGPPRFIWSRKHWEVDTGRTMAEIEHIPQLLEENLLYQNRDYNSQFAYGKYPTYDAFTNLEFRPPLIGQEDILPLSRLPRPVVGIRINPGTAYSSGSTFADSNMHTNIVEKNISDRVKHGDIRPTFFAPMEMPEDNSILPNLETNLPPTSASAGFNFPSIGKIEQPEIYTGYKQFHPETTADVTLIKLSAPDSREHLILDYNRPQVASSAGHNTMVTGDVHSATPNLELGYNRPQVAGYAGRNTRIQIGTTQVDLDLDYNRPQIAATAGYTTFAGGSTTTPIDIELQTKLEGSQPALATPKHRMIYDPTASRVDESKIGDSRPSYSYVVPSNTRYQAKDDSRIFFQQKVDSLGTYNPKIPQSVIRRSGISTPQVRLGMRKNV